MWCDTYSYLHEVVKIRIYREVKDGERSAGFSRTLYTMRRRIIMDNHVGITSNNKLGVANTSVTVNFLILLASYLHNPLN